VSGFFVLEHVEDLAQGLAATVEQHIETGVTQHLSAVGIEADEVVVFAGATLSAGHFEDITVGKQDYKQSRPSPPAALGSYRASGGDSTLDYYRVF
jgi:hypothetical protein